MDCNPNAEQYCLALLAEESGEIVQMVGKAIRFGIDTPGQHDEPDYTPRNELEKELGDITAAIAFAGVHYIVDVDKVCEYAEAKLAKLLSKDSRNNLGGTLAPLPEDNNV